MAKKFGWCFVGAGNIARKVAQDTKGIRVVSVCAAHLESARRFAGEFGGAAYPTLEEAVAAPGVGGVYVCVQHPEHLECVLAALRLGKPVLCEKPLAVNARQVREMMAEAKARGLFLAEAMWPRHNPTLRTVGEWIKAGEIGEVTQVTAEFAAATSYPPNSRLYRPDRAGGALLDIGVYPLAFAQWVYGAKPENFTIQSRLENGVDSRMAMQLCYPGGGTAQLFTAIDTEAPHTAVVRGTKGYITIPQFWRARSAVLTRVGGEEERTRRGGCVGWGYEMRAAEKLMAAGAAEDPAMPLWESLALAETTDEMRRLTGVKYSWD